MSVTSTRVTAITFQGDIVASLSIAAAANTNAPGDIDILSLTTGANNIVLPTGGSTPKGATILPPPGNTVALILKGVSGDTGIAMHLTDPGMITFSTSPPVNFVIDAAGVVDGLRVIWT